MRDYSDFAPSYGRNSVGFGYADPDEEEDTSRPLLSTGRKASAPVNNPMAAMDLLFGDATTRLAEADADAARLQGFQEANREAAKSHSKGRPFTETKRALSNAKPRNQRERDMLQGGAEFISAVRDSHVAAEAVPVMQQMAAEERARAGNDIDALVQVMGNMRGVVAGNFGDRGFGMVGPDGNYEGDTPERAPDPHGFARAQQGRDEFSELLRQIGIPADQVINPEIEKRVPVEFRGQQMSLKDARDALGVSRSGAYRAAQGVDTEREIEEAQNEDAEKKAAVLDKEYTRTKRRIDAKLDRHFSKEERRLIEEGRTSRVPNFESRWNSAGIQGLQDRLARIDDDRSAADGTTDQEADQPNVAPGGAPLKGSQMILQAGKAMGMDHGSIMGVLDAANTSGEFEMPITAAKFGEIVKDVMDQTGEKDPVEAAKIVLEDLRKKFSGEGG